MSGDPHSEAEEKGYDAALMRRLLSYVKPYKGTAVIALVLLLATAGLTLVGPALTQRALDVAIPASDYGLLRTLALLFLGSLLLDFLCDYGQAYLTAWMGQRVMADLRLTVFSHLQRLSVAFFDRMRDRDLDRADIRSLLHMLVDVVIQCKKVQGRFKVTEVHYEPPGKR